MSSFRDDALFGKISRVALTFGRSRFTWLMESLWRHYSAEYSFDLASVASPLSVVRQAFRERLLVISLAVNVAFIAIFSAASIGPPPPTNLRVLQWLECAIGDMPTSDAELLRSQIKVNRVAIETAEAAYRSAQGGVRAALRDEPFDVGALRAAEKKMHAKSEIVSRMVQSIIVFVAERMSPAGKRALLRAKSCR